MAGPRGQSSTVALVAVAALTLVVAWAGGVRPGGGLYSPDISYRRQTEAMFRGTFALQPVPHGQRADWAWGNGSQQVWGLGVPMLRMPGEILARAAGQPGFPDRLTLVALFAIVMVVIVRAIPDPGIAIAAAAAIGLLPAFTTLTRTRMFVYEEAVAYAYLWAALQIGLTIGVASAKLPRWTYAAAAVAGFGAFIRPTLFLYGVVTMIVLAIVNWRRRLVLLSSAAIFAAVTLAVLWTNHARFGDPFEFGQRVNVSRWVLDQYAKNFDYPFAHEPIVSAGQELFAALTRRVPFNGVEFYADGPAIHPWFSPTIRFREFYFTTGLGPFLVLAAIGWVLLGRRLIRDRSTSPPDAMVLVWSGLAFAALTLFYLRMPTMTSRYVVDFAPAIAAGVVGLLFQWRIPAAIATATAIVYVSLSAAIAPTHAAQPLITMTRATALTPQPITQGAPVPSAYRCGDRIGDIGIPFNGVGWNWSGDCRVAAGTTLFLSLPRDHSCVALELEGLDAGALDAIEVKFGVTHLQRTAGRPATFCAPAGFARRPSSVEIISIKWVPVQQLSRAPLESFKMRSITIFS